jgi:hypothetical protein
VSPNLGLGFDTLLTHLSGLSVSLDRELEEFFRPIALRVIAEELFNKSYEHCSTPERLLVGIVWLRLQDQWDHFIDHYLFAEPESEED